MGPTHHCYHTLALVLSVGIWIENLLTVSQNEFISDHFLILHDVVLDYNDCVPSHYRHKRTITAFSIDALINSLPDLTNIPAPLGFDDLERNTEILQSTLQSSLDNVAPIKMKRS